VILLRRDDGKLKQLTHLHASIQHSFSDCRKGTKPSIPSLIRIFTVHSFSPLIPPPNLQPHHHPRPRPLILQLYSDPTKDRSERVILRRNLPLPVTPNDWNLHHDVVPQLGHVCGEEDDEEAEDTAEGCERTAAVGGEGRLACFVGLLDGCGGDGGMMLGWM